MVRLMGTTFVVILVLGLGGNLLAADWTPAGYVTPAEFAQVPPAGPVPPVEPREAPTWEPFRFEADGVIFDGVVHAPGAPGPHPAVVFIHGAGTADPTDFAEQADHLARAGIVAVVPDKRTEGYSPWHRDYERLAEDTLAVVDHVRNRADVDPERIGLFAESEGAWVAPVAAARDPRIAFTVLVSAPVVAPVEQATYATLKAFEGLEVPGPVYGAVAKGIGFGRTIPGLFDYAEFEVLAWVARMTQPTLLIYGTDDPAVPVVQAPVLFLQAIGPRHADGVVVRYFEGAQHGIRTGPEGPFAPGYLDTVATWILPDRELPGPQVAGGQPVQTLSADAAPRAPWFATARVQVAMLGLAVAGHLAGPVASAATRLAKGRAAPRISRERRWSLRLIRLLGVASVVLLVAYFVGLSHLALNDLSNPWFTRGGWAVVWLVATTAVMSVLSVWVGPTWRTRNAGQAAGTGGRPLNAVEKVAVAGAVGGTVLLLVVVAYGGVFRGL